MNALLIFLGVCAWLIFAYRLYGRHLERRLILPNDQQRTPAHTLSDGNDFVPTQRWLLWGHHFASIAGAGPILGPILGLAAFGWGPVVIWLALGSVFIGAVHDYLSIMLSVRHGGISLAEVARQELDTFTGRIFAVLLWITLIFIITVFAVGAANALVHNGALVIPTYGTCLLAAALGIGVYRYKLPWLALTAVVVLGAYPLIWVGYRHPVNLPAHWSEHHQMLFFLVISFVYCLVASLLPVWLMLQPRDFISSIKLLVGMVLGTLGLVLGRPIMQAPFLSANALTLEQPIWPMLFILVACGAVSGFHCMVATGTTSKQLHCESDGRVIGYGGMLAECALALLVLLMVGAGLQWGTAPAGSTAATAGGYFQSSLAQGWIVAFGNGFGAIVGTAGLPLLTPAIAGLLGAVMVKTFVMTSLDTSTRLARFILTESFSCFNRHLSNRVVSTLLVLLPAFLLAATNTYNDIWQLFGASNQLIAAIALVVISAWLHRRNRPRLYTMIPAAFMLLTTIGALGWKLVAANGYLRGAQPNWLLATLSALLIVLAGIVLHSGMRVLWTPVEQPIPATTNAP